uniref:TNR1A factor n=1 Tax=Nothoprocta perdicaria TaxID=30464 RepID=A0A8C6Z4F6_NOTPE
LYALALPRAGVILAFVCVLTEESIEIAPAPYTLQAHRVALDGKDPVSPLRREKRQVQCLLGQYLHPEETHCCMRCHAGTYKVKDCDRPEQAPVCLPCANGTYTAVDNTMSKCFQCTQCRSDFYQIVEAPCTPKQDTVCGCRKNQYQFDVLDRFLCMNCSTCPYGIIANCSKNRNTICRCKPVFVSVCLAIDVCIYLFLSHLLTHLSSLFCPDGIFFLYIIIAVLGVIVVLCMVNKVVKMVQENGIVSSFYPCVMPKQKHYLFQVEAERNVTSIILPESQQETVLLVNATPLAAPMPQSSHELPDCVSPARKTQLPDNPAILYTVVDHVPPSRWKEFVRRLGLSDYDLERIEMEHRRIRDAQYEMLRLWKLQMGHAATVERISCVLNQMELSGCSEAIQEALPNQNFLQPCSLHSHP